MEALLSHDAIVIEEEESPQSKLDAFNDLVGRLGPQQPVKQVVGKSLVVHLRSPGHSMAGAGGVKHCQYRNQYDD